MTPSLPMPLPLPLASPTTHRADELLLTLKLELRLRPAWPQPGGWTAEVSVPGTSGRLAFPNLAALMGWIARLEPALSPAPSTALPATLPTPFNSDPPPGPP